MSASPNEIKKVFSSKKLPHKLEVTVFQRGDMVTVESAAVLPNKTVLSRQISSKRLINITENYGFDHLSTMFDGHCEQHDFDPSEVPKMVEAINTFINQYNVVYPSKRKMRSWEFELEEGGRLKVDSAIEMGVRFKCYLHGPSVTNKDNTCTKVYGSSMNLYGEQATLEEILKRLPEALDQSNIPKGHKVRKLVEDALFA